MIYDICAALTALCAVATPVLLIIFIIKAIRRKPKKWIGLSMLFCLVGTLIFSIIGGACMTDEQRAEREKDKAETSVEESQAPVVLQESTQESEESFGPEPEVETKAERFAYSNDVSVELAESLETVLTGMELTDKSHVGVFHYNLSDVYNWKQIEDWAEGQRYSAWLAQEHVFYIYVKDDVVVGVRDGQGNIFYTAE